MLRNRGLEWCLKMRISLIGAGRVAYHLAHALQQNHQLIQIFSRSLQKAQHVAEQVSADAIDQFVQLNADVDLILIAVSDQAIASVIEQIQSYVPNVLIAHTSGSTHINVLNQYHVRSGVLYPLQTFSFERQTDWKNTPLFVEAMTTQDQACLQQLANELSERVYLYSSEQRLSLHLAAVFACNFSNYCYDIANQVLEAQAVDFSLLAPLILETAHKATQNRPEHMQTGPAMRGDVNILNMHQKCLTDAQRHDFAKVYQLMSEQILQRQQHLK